MSGYKILSINAEKIKRLFAVSLRLDGDNLVVVGQPDQGKTTALDLVWMAFKGRAIGPETISTGSDEAIITVVIGNPERQFTITRKLVREGESGGKLTVRDAEGGKYGATFLDTIVSDLSFDPTEFARAEGKDQVDLLLQVVKLPDGISIEKLDTLRETLYEQRKNVNRDLDKAKAKLPGEEPAVIAEVKISEVLTELDSDLEKVRTASKEKLTAVKAANKEKLAAAKATNEANKAKREKMNGFVNGRAELERQRDSVKEKIQALADDLVKIEKAMSECTATIEAGKPIIAALEDVDEDSLAESLEAEETAIESQLKSDEAPILTKRSTAVTDAEATNAKARTRQAWEKDKAEFDKTKALSESLTKQIEDVDARKKSVLGEVQWPMEGLGIRDGHVTYNDVILAQCGQSVRMRVSFAIAMAMNPKLNTIRIDEGESLGAEGRAEIFKWAAEKDFQVLMSVVKDGPAEEGELEIVDGTLSNLPAAVGAVPALAEASA